MEGALLKKINDSMGIYNIPASTGCGFKERSFLLTKGLLFIPVPEWEGWKYFRSETSESLDHFARWEVFFYPRGEGFWIFLRITWPSVSQILLGFMYPPCHPRLRMDPPTGGNWTHPGWFNLSFRAATIYFLNALTNRY